MRGVEEGNVGEYLEERRRERKGHERTKFREGLSSCMPLTGEVGRWCHRPASRASDSIPTVDCILQLHCNCLSTSVNTNLPMELPTYPPTYPPTNPDMQEQEQELPSLLLAALSVPGWMPNPPNNGTNIVSPSPHLGTWASPQLTVSWIQARYPHYFLPHSIIRLTSSSHFNSLNSNPASTWNHGSSRLQAPLRKRAHCPKVNQSTPADQLNKNPCQYLLGIHIHLSHFTVPQTFSPSRGSCHFPNSRKGR